MKNKRRIIFRADGNSQIGLGHVVRSLALASMLREEFECVFAIQRPSEELQQQIKEVCHGLIMLPQCAPDEHRYIHEVDAYISAEEIVVLDGYHFGTKYQESVKAKGAALVCIDDLHAYNFVCDVLINQAGGVDPTAYEAAPFTKFYFGPSYAMLRSPFLKASQKIRKFPQGKLRVLLTLGGADPKNLTLQLAKELRESDESVEIEVVTGAAYRHQVALQHWVEKQQGIMLHRNLGADQLAQLMLKCAVAVTSASGVAYEYAAVGGILYILQTADNQSDLKQFLLNSGIAKSYNQNLSLPIHHTLKSTFKEQVGTQRSHFDGESGTRLRKVFTNLSLAAGLRLRLVTADDLQLLFRWANDPEVRRHSFNSSPIPLEVHSRWLADKLLDKNALLYIAEVDGEPAGHIRFAVEDDRATLSYLISADFRGQGLAHLLLTKGTEQLKAAHPELTLLEGLVQPENIASVRAFEKAGFKPQAPSHAHPDAIRFVRELLL